MYYWTTIFSIVKKVATVFSHPATCLDARHPIDENSEGILQRFENNMLRTAVSVQYLLKKILKIHGYLQMLSKKKCEDLAAFISRDYHSTHPSCCYSIR